MNAQQEQEYYQQEWEAHIRHCRTFGVRAFPANHTTKYDAQGREIYDSKTDANTRIKP